MAFRRIGAEEHLPDPLEGGWADSRQCVRLTGSYLPIVFLRYRMDKRLDSLIRTYLPKQKRGPLSLAGRSPRERLRDVWQGVIAHFKQHLQRIVALCSTNAVQLVYVLEKVVFHKTRLYLPLSQKIGRGGGARARAVNITL